MTNDQLKEGEIYTYRWAPMSRIIVLHSQGHRHFINASNEYSYGICGNSKADYVPSTPKERELLLSEMARAGVYLENLNYTYEIF